GNYFIPTSVAVESATFKEWASSDTYRKTVFDGKRATVALRWQGVTFSGIDFDCLIAAYVINPTDSTVDIAAVANQKGINDLETDEAVYGKGAKRCCPAEHILSVHLVRKALAVRKLRDILTKELVENEQAELFADLEMPLSLIL